MTVISDYRTVPVLRDAIFPEDLEAIVKDPANRTLEVVIGLTDVSDIVAFTRPREGLVIVRAALELAGRLTPETAEWNLAHLRAFSVGGSRLRGIGAVDAANAKFFMACQFLHRSPDAPLGERGDLRRRVGFLRIQEGVPNEGLEYSCLSQRDFERAGNRHGVGCALVCRGEAYWHLRKFNQAAEDFRTAVALLDPNLGFNHVWAASTNLAVALIEGAGALDDLDEALCQLRQVDELRRYDSGTRPCLTVWWAEARLLMKLGRHAVAQEKLLETCSGMRNLGLPYELTLASLDLARCYFEQGYLAEVVDLAGEMFPLFARFRHDAPAYRALIAFHQATMKGRLRPSTITEARTAVELARIAA